MENKESIKIISLDNLMKFYNNFINWCESTFKRKDDTIILKDIIINNWINIEDTEHPFNFYSNIENENITENDFCEVVFNTVDALSGYFSPVCDSYNGGVTIYSKTSNNVEIPTIIIHKF